VECIRVPSSVNVIRLHKHDCRGSSAVGVDPLKSQCACGKVDTPDTCFRLLIKTGRSGEETRSTLRRGTRRGSWSGDRVQVEIVETARGDVRRSAVASYYRGKEGTPVVVKLGQRKLGSRCRALVELERNPERRVDIWGQEWCPVVGIRCNVAQRSAIRKDLDDTGIGDLGHWGRLGVTTIVVAGEDPRGWWQQGQAFPQSFSIAELSLADIRRRQRGARGELGTPYLAVAAGDGARPWQTAEAQSKQEERDGAREGTHLGPVDSER